MAGKQDEPVGLSLAARVDALEAELCSVFKMLSELTERVDRLAIRHFEG